MGKDPLSVVLFGAVLLLGLMYVLDERSRSTLLDRDQAARRLASSRLKGCEVGAIGHDGAELMVRCAGADVSGVAAKLGPGAVDSGFSSVSVRDDSGTRVCPPATSGWPASCQELQPLPERAVLEEARRRRTRSNE